VGAVRKKIGGLLDEGVGATRQTHGPEDDGETAQISNDLHEVRRGVHGQFSFILRKRCAAPMSTNQAEGSEEKIDERTKMRASVSRFSD
jgi:hypothetical protein